MSAWDGKVRMNWLWKFLFGYRLCHYCEMEISISEYNNAEGLCYLCRSKKITLELEKLKQKLLAKGITRNG